MTPREKLLLCGLVLALPAGVLLGRCGEFQRGVDSVSGQRVERILVDCQDELDVVVKTRDGSFLDCDASWDERCIYWGSSEGRFGHPAYETEASALFMFDVVPTLDGFVYRD